tara:strand:+ start:23916 stop:24212 length:297 start_codon:yes stop_codon:yes gene_type:complete
MTANDFAFSPDSELWLVNRYANGLLFGPAAVLLQVAHPQVAQGVVDHSDFREDALGRLRRTLSTVNRIAFGTKVAFRTLPKWFTYYPESYRAEKSMKN